MFFTLSSKAFADHLVGLTLHQKPCNGSTNYPKFDNATTCPTYLVGLDILKGDVQSRRSIISLRNSESWQKCFSCFLALSSSFQKDLPADAPLLLGTDGRIEVHGSWIRRSSYFLSNNGRVVCVLTLFFLHSLTIILFLLLLSFGVLHVLVCGLFVVPWLGFSFT